MPGIKLTEVEMQFISLFEAITQVEARDCIMDDETNTVIFVVGRGQAGRAVGEGGANVKTLKRFLKKNVEIVEESDTLEGLLRSAFFPANVKLMAVKRGDDGSNIAFVNIPPEQRGVAIGKRGKNLRKARLLARRYFDIDRIVLR